jgi:hypothetical protein
MSLSGLRYRRPDHSEIKYKQMRFLITDRPNDQNVDRYTEVRLIIDNSLIINKPFLKGT